MMATQSLDATSAQWWNGDAFRTRVFDALSLIIPAGEQFLLETVDEWLGDAHLQQFSYPRLREQSQRFLAEEKKHQRAHRRYNERLELQVPALRLEGRIADAMAEMAGWSLPTRLAFSGAIEHLTAVLSAEILHKQGAWLVQGTTSQSRLWRWHCEEELGHRDVLPNILYAASISRLRRKLAFAAAALYFAADLAWTLAIMCRCDWKAGRIGMGQLGWQAIKFGVKATPNLIRMTWQSLQYLFK